MNDLHVIPENDEQEHVAAMSCPCAPRRVDRDIVVHQAWDRREVIEEVERKLSGSSRDHFVPDECGGGSLLSDLGRWAGRSPARWVFLLLAIAAVAGLVWSCRL